MNPLVYPWLAELGLVIYRDAAQTKRKGEAQAPKPIPGLPVPAEIAGTMIVFGLLSLAPGQGARVATAAGWGLVVATALNLWGPGGKVRQVPSSTKAANVAATPSR